MSEIRTTLLTQSKNLNCGQQIGFRQEVLLGKLGGGGVKMGITKLYKALSSFFLFKILGHGKSFFGQNW